MTPDDARKRVMQSAVVTREDIARAKGWILLAKCGGTKDMAEKWLAEQSFSIPRMVDLDAPGCEDTLDRAGRSYGLMQSFFQATWELIGAGELFLAGGIGNWESELAYKTRHVEGSLELKVRCSYPASIERPPSITGVTVDPDIFLKGVDCITLHEGIREAIEQSLACFKRGLYMPATAMLAAAVEATWTECGVAVAKKLSNARLDGAVQDPMTSVSKVVFEVRTALEDSGAKPLLKTAHQSIAKVRDAEVWTTVLRERRNALHWTKTKSFVTDHSGTASLLMAAPLHIGTLESIRVACV